MPLFFVAKQSKRSGAGVVAKHLIKLLSAGCDKKSSSNAMAFDIRGPGLTA
jgi:hypothetical protein